MKNLGILISGRGSNFEAIARSVVSGQIPARIVTVISNRAEARRLEVAREMGFHARCIPSKGRTREDFERELLEALLSFQIDLMLLAGFVSLLSPNLVHRCPHGILNTQNTLPPAI